MSDNLLSSFVSPYEVQQRFAQVLKQIRRSRKHSRRKASVRTGVPEATIRRFEDTGEISLRQFLVLWDNYCELRDLDRLARESFQSLNEVDVNSINIS